MSFTNNYPQTINNLYLWLDAQDNSTITLNANLAITQIREKASNVILSSVGNIGNLVLTTDINNKQTILFNNYLYNNVFLQGNVAFNSNVYTGSSFIVMKSINQAGLYGSPLQNNAILNWGNIYTFGYRNNTPSSVNIYNNISSITTLNAIIVDTTITGSVSFRNNVAIYATYSAYFTGTLPYFELTDVTSLSSSLTSDFTIEMWYLPTNSIGNAPNSYLTRLLGNFQTIFSTASNTFNGFFIIHNVDNRLYLAAPGDRFYTRTNTGGNTLNLNTWNHIAVTYISSSQTTSLYLNGNLAHRTNSFNLNSLPWKNDWTIGAANTPSTNVDGNLYGTETFTVNGTITQSNANPRFNVSSYYSNGTGYLTINNITTTNMTGTWTVECWFYTTSISAWQQIWNCYQTNAGDVNCWCSLSGGRLRVILGTNNARNVLDQNPNVAYSINTWNHVAVVYDGTAYSAYYNGTRFFNITSGVVVTPETFSRTNIGSWSGSQLFFGYIDEFRISSTARYSGSTFNVPGDQFTYDTNTTLLLHFDGVNDQEVFFSDPGFLGEVFTVVGTVTQSIDNFRYGRSSYFSNGTGYLNIAARQLSFSNWTVSTWFFTTSTGGQVLWNFYNTSISEINCYCAISSNQLRVVLGINNSRNIINQNPTASFSINTWNHVAIVYDGSTYAGYLNGVRFFNITSAVVIPDSVFNNVHIGGYNGGSRFFGYIDDFRLSTDAKFSGSSFTPPLEDPGFGWEYSLILTFNNAPYIPYWRSDRGSTYSGGPTNPLNNGYINHLRISNNIRYNTNTTYTVPTSAFSVDANTVYLNTFDQVPGIAQSYLPFSQLAPNTFLPYINGSGSVVFSNTTAKYATNSLYVTGWSSCYDITVSDLNTLLTNNDFTIEMWYYPTASLGITSNYLGNFQAIFGTASATIESFFLMHVPDGNFYIAVPNGARSIYNFFGGTSPYTINLNQWNHLAVTYTASSTTTRLWVNGFLSFSSTINLSTFNWIQRWTVGCVNPLPAGHFGFPGGYSYGINGGYINHLRVSNTVRYTNTVVGTTYTIPQSAFVPDRNTIYLNSFNQSSGILLSNSQLFPTATTNTITNTLTYNTGNATISTTQSRYGVSSLYFNTNAISNFVSISGLANVRLQSNWTYECWVYPSSSSAASGSTNYQTLWSVTPGNNANMFMAVSLAPTSRRLTLWLSNISTSLDISSNIQGTTSATINSWNHVALVWNRTRYSLYLNGNLQVSVNNSNIVPHTNLGNICLGALNNDTRYGLNNGYIDEFRISSSSRYAGNFTPTTSLFTSDSSTVFLHHLESYSNLSRIENAGQEFPAITNALIYQNNYIINNNWYLDNVFTTVSTNINNSNSFIATLPDFSGTTSNIQIARDPSGNTTPLVLGELLIYNRTLSTLEQANVYAYLNNKWNIYSTSNNTTSTSFVLGRNTDINNKINQFQMNGYLDDFLISNVSRYTGNTYVVPANAFVKTEQGYLLVNFNGNANTFAIANTEVSNVTLTTVNYGLTNYLNYSFYWASNGATISTVGQTRFGTGSLFINNNYAVYTNSTALSSIPYTIEFWYNLTSFGVLLGGAIGNTFYSLITVSLTSTTIAFPGMSSPLIINNFNELDTWTHVSLVCTTNTITFYFKGSNLGTFSGSYTSNFNALMLGVGGSGSTNLSTRTLVGFIDEFRLSNNARYSGNFTPPTTTFVYDSNTITLNHFDGTNGLTNFNLTVDITSTGVNSVITNTNNIYQYTLHDSTLSTSLFLFGTASLFINSNYHALVLKDTITVPSTIEFWYYIPRRNTYTITTTNNNITFGIDNTFSLQNYASFNGTSSFINSVFETMNLTNNSWTIETWVYFNTVSTTQVIFTTVFSGSVMSLVLSGSALILRIGTTISSWNIIASYQISGTLSTLRWYNVAIVCTAGSIQGYISGTAYGTPVTATVNISSITRLLLGQQTDNTSFLNGWLSQFRISLTARYSSSFTPSSVNFILDSNTLYFNKLDNNEILSTYMNLAPTFGPLLGTYSNGSFYTIINLTGTTTTASLIGMTPITINNIPQINKWTHLALSCNTNTVSLFIDGCLMGSYTGSYTLTNMFLLGSGGSSSTQLINTLCYIDEFRISKSIRYSSPFIIPTSAFVYDTNTTVLNHFNGVNNTQDINITDDKVSSGTNNITLLTSMYYFNYSSFGAIISNTSITRYGSNSLYINNNYAILSVNTITKPFTIEFFYNLVFPGILLGYYTTTFNTLVELTGTSTIITIPGSSTMTIVNFPQTTVWTHFCIVGLTNGFEIYINGVLQRTYTGSYTVPSILVIGGGGTASSTVTSNLVGYIDELRISNNQRYTTSFNVPTSAFNKDTNTITLNHFNGTSGSNNLLSTEDFVTTTSSSISFTNNVSNVLYTLVNSTINGGSSKYGGVSLNLNNSYCIINFSSTLSTTFTIEFWYQCTTIGTVMSYRTNAGIFGNFITLTNNATQIQLPGMTGPIIIYDLPELGLWTHLAIMGNHTSITTYINGIFFNVSSASYTMPDTLFLGIPSNSSSSLGTPNFVGYIDEFRVSNIRRYSSNFLNTGTFAFDSNTITLNHFDNSSVLLSIDTTTGTNTITNAPSTLSYLYKVSPPSSTPGNHTFTRLNNVVQSTTQNKFGVSSLYLTGGNYLTVGNITTTNMTGNWTVECWVYPLNVSNWQLIWNCYQSSAGDVNCWCEINGGTLGFILGSGNGRQVCNRSPTTPITINTWHHVVCVYNNGTYSAYLNGTRFLNITSATVVPASTFSITNLGTWSGSQLLNGYIDEFRISSTARYSGASFTSPISAFDYDTNTTLLLHFDGGNNSPSFVSEVSSPSIQISTNQFKFGSSSLQFLSGYFTLERINIITSFTLEFWFYCTNYGSIVSTYSINNNNYQNIIYITNTFIEITLPNFSNSYRLFCLPQLNTWYHLAVVYVASYYDSSLRQNIPNHIKVFLNGYYIGYYTNTLSSLAYFIFGIGSGNVATSTSFDITNKFQGYIDELLISSSAKYSASFIVQNSEYFRDARTIVLNHFNDTAGNTEINATEDTTLITSSSNTITTMSPYILYQYTTYGSVALNTLISSFNLASMQFNGGYVLFNGKDTFTNPFTIEIFFYYTTVGTILGYLNTSGFNDIVRITSNSIIFTYPGTTSTTVTQSLTSSTWHHLAICGNSTQVNLFINGSLIASGTTYTTISNLLFGRGTISTFRGFMTEFRTSIIERYTTTFTPTKIPFIRDTNTIALNHFNGKKDVTDFNTTEVIIIDRNTLVNTNYNFYVNESTIVDSNISANLVGLSSNTAANSTIDIIKIAPEGAIIQRVRQLITTHIKVYKPANVSPITQTLTQTSVSIPNPTTNYTYALGIQDATQFPSNVQYSARFYLKIFDTSNTIVTNFTTPLTVKIQLNNYTGNSSTLVVQKLDEETNVYEEFGYANTTGVYQEYNLTLTTNSDFQILNSNVNVEGIGGGDPHFSPLFGKEYTFCDDTKTYRLFENTFENKYFSEKIFINGKTWKLPTGQARRSKLEHRRYLYNYTFLKYVSVIFVKNGITESLIIDMDTLKFHRYTSIDDENNLTLPEIEDESSINLTELTFDDITVEKKNLYRIPIDTIVTDNTETMDRNIKLTTIKLGVIDIELVSLPTDELDRNHIKLHIERDCTEFNSFGLLVKEGQIKELSSIMEM
jgi:hypothetical protein